MKNKTTDIGTIPKRDDCDIKAQLVQFKGAFYCDIREHLNSERYTGPTAKGLRFNTENWPAFFELMKQIDETIKEQA